MRILPVTGELPALATSPPALVRNPDELAPAPATAPVERTAATDTEGASSGDRRPPNPKPFFDPPLIAQRAVLGLPTAHLIADFARSQGVAYAAVAAAVDREMPSEAD